MTYILYHITRLPASPVIRKDELYQDGQFSKVLQFLHDDILQLQAYSGRAFGEFEIVMSVSGCDIVLMTVAVDSQPFLNGEMNPAPSQDWIDELERKLDKL